MKFYKFDETEKQVNIFNERWYPREIDDKVKWYRNVTTILGIIDKGYNYDEWLKNVGHNAEIIVDRAGRFGTAFHELVRRFLLGETVKHYDNQYLGERPCSDVWERFNLWIDFWKEIKGKVEYKPEGVEYIVYSDEHEYAGTIDFICKIDGVPTIFDWKTGNQIGNKEELQMIAYMQPLGIKKANLVHMPSTKPNKKGYRIKEIDFTEDKFDLFLATKRVFEMENSDKPKLLTLPLEINKDELI